MGHALLNHVSIDPLFSYMELEETVLQYKQPTHIMRLLDPHNQVYRVSRLPVHPKTREDREEYFRRGNVYTLLQKDKYNTKF